MNINELEKKVKMIESQLMAREGALRIKQAQFEELINALQEINEKNLEMSQAMNGMQLEGQNVVAELEQTKSKNKALLEEKKAVEKELELSNTRNVFISGTLELEQQKTSAMSDLLEYQKSVISYIPQKNLVSNSTRTGKEIPLPIFEGNPLEFQRWINNVDEYFIQYSHIADFERKFRVVSSLTKKVK
ncbi:hypothetical protein AYI69_g4497 [Smittium culicis]|uniref:Uncharacterized protein n=1 Tax=Smittium culicis TaxID=133412 RepID=A0A1R1YD86_9FUNG|nr:hypothetical protein AYI69_g4497 [Smittium culicis]